MKTQQMEKVRMKTELYSYMETPNKKKCTYIRCNSLHKNYGKKKKELNKASTPPQM